MLGDFFNSLYGFKQQYQRQPTDNKARKHVQIILYSLILINGRCSFVVQYQSEYDAKYQEHMAGVPLPAEKKVAGQSSMETLVAREPAFTHKRRVELANVRKDQVAHAVDFTGQRMDVVCVCM